MLGWEFSEIGATMMKRAPTDLLSPSRVFNERFVIFFGVDPLVVSIVWAMIMAPFVKMISETVADKRDHDLNGARPEHLLWELMFLKI